MTERMRVLVAGAGPVGLTVALLLARSDIEVTVLEAGPALSRESRASTFHPPTLDLLDGLGITEQLQAIGIIARRYQMRDRRRGVFAEFDLAALAGDTAHPYRVQCEQSRFTPFVLRRLRRHPKAQVLFNHRVVAVDPRDDRVRVQVEVDGRPIDFEAEWLIGSDGASSAVRGSVGIPFEGMTYPERYLVVTTTYDLIEALPDLAYVNYIADPSEFVVLLRLPNVWRAMFPITSEESDNEALSVQSVQRRLCGVADLGASYPVQHCIVYRVHQRVAPTFRQGRVLLAGDAAHINNPLGGMGMNSGIHDAFLLAGRLAAVITGEQDDHALDLYAAHRRAVALRYVRPLSHENFQQMQERDESERVRQQDELARIAADAQLSRTFLRQRTLIDALEEERVLVSASG